MAQSDKPMVGLKTTQNQVNIISYSDFLNLTIDNSTLKDLKLEVYNIIGGTQKLRVQEVKKNKNYKIDTKKLATGYYLLVLKDSRTKFNQAYRFRKILKEGTSKKNNSSDSKASKGTEK
ncbi:MAG: hypothetical protein MI784_02230 [Cytophagales bacterium]|nr:hypothetical protein [Cytophagales bacterium]